MYRNVNSIYHLVHYIPAAAVAAAAKSLSHVHLFVTPWTIAHQAPLSLGFSRQECWNGLSFPSLMHACMLNHFSRVWLCAILWTAAHQASLSTGFSRQEYWSGLAIPFSRGSSQSRDWTRVSCIEGRFFTIWATREVLELGDSHLYRYRSREEIL